MISQRNIAAHRQAGESETRERCIGEHVARATPAMVSERVWSAIQISATSARFSTCGRHSCASHSRPGTSTRGDLFISITLN